MGWSIGFDPNWKRDIGYGVPAYCDEPGCGRKLTRGIAHVCGGEPFGGDDGCGLFFCDDHLLFGENSDGRRLDHVCSRCLDALPPCEPAIDHPEWLHFKLVHDSWEHWRGETPDLKTLLRPGEADALLCHYMAPQPLEDWHEDDGSALWWRFPINEAPFCGSPLNDDWPGYHTHWTPIPMPILKRST